MKILSIFLSLGLLVGYQCHIFDPVNLNTSDYLKEGNSEDSLFISHTYYILKTWNCSS